MPRTGRGGSRSGTPGQSYSNRTDLPGKVPMMAASGQTYGVKAQQMAAQRAIPVAAAPSGLQPQGAPSGPGGPAGAVVPPDGSQAPPGPLPGSLGGLHDPTERPTEPITAGLPVGPGPGPEALNMPQQDVGTQYQSALQQVQSLAASSPGNNAVAYLAASLQGRF